MQNQSDFSTSTAQKTSAGNGLLPAATKEVSSFLRDIEDVIKNATSLTTEDLAAVKAKISAQVTAVAERTRETVKATDTYVHEQPWKAVGFGAAAGVLIGILLARRR